MGTDYSNPVYPCFFFRILANLAFFARGDGGQEVEEGIATKKRKRLKRVGESLKFTDPPHMIPIIFFIHKMCVMIDF